MQTDRLTEIYKELQDGGVFLSSGSYHLKGECDSIVVCDGIRYGIFLDIDKIQTLVQEKEAVSHEWAHIVTGATYTFDVPPAVRQKAERRAEVAKIKKLLPFDELRGAIKNGYNTIFELSEYFMVSEDTVSQAVEYYTGPCGLRF